jgi:mannan endo-1,4-beta-mannosidase
LRRFRRFFVLALILALIGTLLSLFVSLFDSKLQENAFDSRSNAQAARGFITRRDGEFQLDGRPFKFVGANIAVMYRDEDRARMPETMRAAAHNGVQVVRVWAFGEGGTESRIKALTDERDWSRKHPFRFAPDEWNEEAFEFLDRVIAEAAKNNLRVQLCLTNWWRDTGGVTQYLDWAGIKDAADDRQPFGINVERAMLFYTNEATRRMYRAHVERIITRRNSVTGVLYRDDPTIFAYELMNEAQAPTGRWAERRQWVAEMSAFVKSLDPNHLVTPGTWGYRNAVDRRAWLEEHALPDVDFCDAHLYPRDDTDSFVDSIQSLREFINNRVAAAYSLKKPLVFGEFGMSPDGYKGVSQIAWFRAYFEQCAQAGASGALFWILTPDAQRGYGIAYTAARDADVLRAIQDGARMFENYADSSPPDELKIAAHHLVPRQFAFERSADDPLARPIVKNPDQKSLVYSFAPEAAARGRFEKLGGASGYVWGYGVGSFEYEIPARDGWRRVREIIVRAHLQPVLPHDARGRVTGSRVTLFLNGEDCGSRLVLLDEQTPASANKPDDISTNQSNNNSTNPTQFNPIQEWRINSLSARLAAARGKRLTLRFSVTPDADLPYGLNISGSPANFDAQGRAPVEVEIK